MSTLLHGESFRSLWTALDIQQDLLPGDKAHALGDEFTTTDTVILLFLARLEVALNNDIGAYTAGECTKAAKIFSSVRFKRLLAYFEGIKARENFKATFNEVCQLFLVWVHV